MERDCKIGVHDKTGLEMSARLTAIGAAAGVLLLAGCSASNHRSLPANLPSIVRILPGAVTATNVDGPQWQVWVKVQDVVAGYKTARTLLVGAGFQTTYENLYSTSGEGQFCTAKYCVDVNAYNDPAHGKTVGYYVYLNSGLGLPKS